ncbi:MAG: alcohol dehydrogenase catalytic domain-containing protein [Candidatus Brocadiia bacterium]
MKAAVIREHGEPDVIRVEDIPTPEPGDGEVLVDVKAAALNHLDIWVRQGGRQDLEWPHVLGSDAAGVISAVGPGVEGVSVGDEVIIDPGLACGHCRFCRDGEHSLCENFGIVGMHRPGTFAEQLTVPARCVAPKPAHLDFQEASALCVAYLTAWRMLFTRARVQPGETVLIHGIGGGVALAALQFLQLTSARAIVTSSSDEKLEQARALGADETINYHTIGDLPARVLELAGERGVDIAFDTVGAATWLVDLEVVRRGGRIVICGVTTGAEATTNLQALYWNQISALGSTLGTDAELRDMLTAIETAGMEPVVDTVFPLDEVRQATELMEGGEQFGKIVLAVE